MFHDQSSGSVLVYQVRELRSRLTSVAAVYSSFLLRFLSLTDLAQTGDSEPILQFGLVRCGHTRSIATTSSRRGWDALQTGSLCPRHDRDSLMRFSFQARAERRHGTRCDRREGQHASRCPSDTVDDGKRMEREGDLWAVVRVTKGMVRTAQAMVLSKITPEFPADQCVRETLFGAIYGIAWM